MIALMWSSGLNSRADGEGGVVADSVFEARQSSFIDRGRCADSRVRRPLLRRIWQTSRRCSGSTCFRIAVTACGARFDRLARVSITPFSRPTCCSMYCRAGRHLSCACAVRRRAMSQRLTPPERIEYSSFMTQVTTPRTRFHVVRGHRPPPHGAPVPAIRRRQSRPSAVKHQRQPNRHNRSRTRLQGCNRSHLDGSSSRAHRRLPAGVL